tara:strand:- start:19262 stop:20698 length:1437 start_codon:yes stop_codon:yes gene_type:complete
MKLKNKNIYIIELLYDSMKKISRVFKIWILCLILITITSCESFVEIDPPKNTLISQTVFEDVATIESALANIYYKMREEGMVSGNFGLSVLMGSYADELDYYGVNIDFLKLYNHNVSASDATVSNWWSTAYNIIYAANDILDGIEQSIVLDTDDRDRFKGQALFVRGYMHSLLVMIYGDIPYIETTDYITNNSVFRIEEDIIYEKIIIDLTDAVSLLNDTDTTGEHVIPNQSAANALLARMYLYTENWEKAEETSSKLISSFSLEPDVDDVFLKNASETIWQFKPGGPNIKNTQEGQVLIITFIPTQGFAISDNLFSAFEAGDLRATNWINSITSSDGLTTLNYAYKYKETINSASTSLEYSIIFRLAEQYLIRAEARAYLDDVSGATQDINIIRNRAGLGETTANTKNDLLEAIFKERQLELFTEHGQRWFDLKRTERASDVLQLLKTNWKNTQVLLPIPDTELLVNSNLKPQNSGY